MRQVSSSDVYSQVLVSEQMVYNRTFFSSRGIIQQAPLYIYIPNDTSDLFSGHSTGEKIPNLDPKILENLTTNFKTEITPEDIFYYIYAVLYSNNYRTKYAEFLKIKFPRIPFTKNYKLFTRLSRYGQQLADLHLLRSKELDKTICKFPESGDNDIEKINYDCEKVCINKEQYFEGVKEKVWKYHIGGYQVCDKWLKDRKGRVLSSEDIKIYCKIVTALSKTIELQTEIDKYYDNVEKTL